MTSRELVEMREMAEAIAADLFVDGAGQKADRFVAELAGKHLGVGWSEAGATMRIERTLLRIAKASPAKDARSKARPKQTKSPS
jgi:hypothetical protein